MSLWSSLRGDAQAGLDFPEAYHLDGYDDGDSVLLPLVL
jgi:hypothetical protein